jgi:hypothetical protein
MAAIFSTLRDFILALTFGWLGLSFEAPDERALARQADRPAPATATTCPTGASACASSAPSYRADCQD